MAEEKVQAFVIGVQKGGTTALSRFLAQHPGINMSKRKEVHFFDDESVDWTDPDVSRLHAAFEDRPGALRMECTPITVYWPHALERLQRYNPDARLILLLRHPGRRAYSHWRFASEPGRETLPFSAAIRPEGRARVAAAPGGADRVFSYVERGFYAWQIERLLSLFPRDQVLFLRTDRLFSEHGPVLSEIERFLDLDPFLTQHVAPRRHGTNFSKDLSMASAADFAYLLDLFREDIARTAQLTGLDLSDWTDPDYREPMEEG